MDLVHVGEGDPHQRILHGEAITQDLDALLGRELALLLAVVLVDFGDLVGDLSGLRLVFAVNVDLDDAGVADLAWVDELGEDLISLLLVLAQAVFLIPPRHELEVVNDLAEHLLGLEDFELGHHEIGIEAALLLLWHKATDVPDVLLHVHADGAHVGRLHQVREHGCGAHDEGEDDEDQQPAHSDDAPVVEEVQAVLRSGGSRVSVLWCRVHELKRKEAGVRWLQPPSQVTKSSIGKMPYQVPLKPR